MKINCDLTHIFMEMDTASYQQQIDQIHQKLHCGTTPNTNWVTYPSDIAPEMVQSIIDTAQQIREQCTAFVVIGIGGSFLGAMAGLELLQSPFYNEYYAPRSGLPRIYFAGQHLSSLYYHELLELLADEEVCVCVISKSGSTMEPMVVFEVFKAFLQQKYAQQAVKRIYAITDAHRGALHEEAMREGYTTFAVPDDIGGRYSVLTPVGLLPLAVGGIDIRAVLAGAAHGQRIYGSQAIDSNDCYRYGLVRHLLEQSGKTMEIFEVYDGELRYFTEWLKQLFGESGCKDGRGIFPASLLMSTDLHSMGQFLQQGRQDFFETAVVVEHIHKEFSLPTSYQSAEVTTMHQLNGVIQESVRKAHSVNETPNIIITLPDISPESFGLMVYFFEKACAVSCYLDGVEPFDQPGVEDYKRNIKKALGKA